MGSKRLKAVVIGAGWSGEGHTKALQHYGVDVLAICARKEEVVQKVAAGLDVPNASTDWRGTLEEVKPDVLALTTPASLRAEVIEVAAGLGCHIICEKPLAINAEEARRLYEIVHRAGVKHAFAATHKYDPSITWMVDLIGEGMIGKLEGIDVIFSRPRKESLSPWVWGDTLAHGGGALNFGLTHILGLLEKITGGKLIAAVGEARVNRKKAPFLSDMHDSREWGAREISQEEAADLEWRTCDADDAYSALLHIESFLRGNQELIPVLVRWGPSASASGLTNGVYVSGEKGTLVWKGLRTLSVYRQLDSEVEPLPIPERIFDSLPQLGKDLKNREDDCQNKWAALVREFIADVRNEPHEPYLTFQDGWRYQEAIDAIRGGKGWHHIPEEAR